MSETSPTTNHWNEDNSASFIDMGEIFVPDRAEQRAVLLQLIPAHSDEEFTLVELAAGEGILAEAILENFPHCHYIALDGSAMMREKMAARLARFGSRLSIEPFELSAQTWRTTLPYPLRCVLSSLSVHHLSDAEKRHLFSDMAKLLKPTGALLLADIIKPATPRIAHIYAQQYDEIVKQQSLAIRGDLSGYEQFCEAQWNYFRYGHLDSYDQPSLLSDQLRWLQEVGFHQIDCYWLRAGHAIYGGYI